MDTAIVADKKRAVAASLGAAETPTLIQSFYMNTLFGIFGSLKTGRLEMTLPDGSVRTFGDPAAPAISFTVNRYAFFTKILLDGDVGFGEAYTAGDWDTEDLAGVVVLFIENGAALAEHYARIGRIGEWVNKIIHWTRKNTVLGSSQNIKAHYDLSNEFFQSFLDPTMTYSCAVYERPEESLDDAQRRKRRMIMNKARLKPADHVLEIGPGWGSFAIEAAKEIGCKVTAITLSEQQYSHIQRRIQEEHLEGKVEVLLRDYRHMNGQFDKVVSIEMAEAVGHKFLGTYFNTIDRCLKPHGLAVIQVITMPDQRYNAYRKRCDWIQKHIFPGSLLPSLTAMSEAMTRESQLTIEHLENIGIHYARTLREWRQRFGEAKSRLSSLGFGTDVQRTWDYYFAYCEAGFATRTIYDLQLILTRQNNKRLISA